MNMSIGIDGFPNKSMKARISDNWIGFGAIPEVRLDARMLYEVTSSCKIPCGLGMFSKAFGV